MEDYLNSRTTTNSWHAKIVQADVRQRLMDGRFKELYLHQSNFFTDVRSQSKLMSQKRKAIKIRSPLQKGQELPHYGRERPSTQFVRVFVRAERRHLAQTNCGKKHLTSLSKPAKLITIRNFIHIGIKFCFWKGSDNDNKNEWIILSNGCRWCCRG